MIVRLLRKARADLDSIGEYIARDNPSRAPSFLAELMAKVNGLSTMAESFPSARLRPYPHIRRRSHGRYGIFYSVNVMARRVMVHRILHSSQDLARAFNA